MQRLFAGTEWDRPPSCDRCGRPEADCVCPPVPNAPGQVQAAPETQTARLRLEKRARGKVVTLVTGLDPLGNDLPALASYLKTSCGSGGTVKGGTIELQGDRMTSAEDALRARGYKTRSG